MDFHFVLNVLAGLLILAGFVTGAVSLVKKDETLIVWVRWLFAGGLVVFGFNTSWSFLSPLFP